MRSLDRAPELKFGIFKGFLLLGLFTQGWVWGSRSICAASLMLVEILVSVVFGRMFPGLSLYLFDFLLYLERLLINLRTGCSLMRDPREIPVSGCFDFIWLKQISIGRCMN